MMNPNMENGEYKAWRFAIIGLGKRSFSCYVPLIMKTQAWTLVSVCDINESVISEFDKKYNTSSSSNIKTYQNYIDLVNELTSFPINVVIVSVYHNSYFKIVEEFLSRNINVIKEKPFASSLKSALSLESLIRLNQSVKFMCAVQRRFNPFYADCKSELANIGNVKHVRVIKDIAKVMVHNEWRMSKQICGGGALLDTGYHIIDLLFYFFGCPSSFKEPTFIYKNGCNRVSSDEVEESFQVKFTWNDSSDTKFDSFVYISRCGKIKEDYIYIDGTHGSIFINDKFAKVFLEHGDSPKIITNKMEEVEIIQNMISQFLGEISAARTKKRSSEPSFFDDFLERDCNISKFIFDIYAYENANTVQPKERSSNSFDYTWPRVTSVTKECVFEQLKTSLSIYDRSGIIKEFEENFLEFINSKSSFSLLFNSGTMAISAMFKGINLMPNDYVIVPVYTFHATVSPIMHYGAIPIFCDCDQNGNMDPAALEDIIKLGSKVSKLKAVMVTHMWGQPAQIIKIAEICKSNNITLLEDCSHSHGALVDGKTVGTFGAAAVWSLQGQKIITGGEGGILVTNDKEIYSQALVYGHYNKRCQQELSQDSILYRYVITGSGYKLRSHPLAVAVANQQLKLAPSFLEIKNEFAKLLIDELKHIPFLVMPSVDQNDRPAWYAFIMKFKSNGKFTRDDFYQSLKKAGLTEVDIPKSTKLLNDEPLFTEPHHVLPHIYGEPSVENIKSYKKRLNLLNPLQFASAQEFYDSALKLPVWAYQDERKIVEFYIKTIKSVADTFLHSFKW